MANVDALDIELFIGEVKEHPEIWDTNQEDYHDRTRKRAAWINICRSFYHDFDDKEDIERNEICNKLMKTWKNLKDSFLKSLKKQSKSGQAAESRRRYIYARQLSFLQQAGATIETQSSMGGKDDPRSSHDDQMHLDESNLDDCNIICEEEPKSNCPPRYDPSSKKLKRDLESALIDFMQAPVPQPVAPVPNADRAFFESILHSIEAFSEDQKLDFRCEVLSIIKRMRMSQASVPDNRSSSYPATSSLHVTRAIDRGVRHRASPTSGGTPRSRIQLPPNLRLVRVETMDQDENGNEMYADVDTKEEYLQSE